MIMIVIMIVIMTIRPWQAGPCRAKLRASAPTERGALLEVLLEISFETLLETAVGHPWEPSWRLFSRPTWGALERLGRSEMLWGALGRSGALWGALGCSGAQWRALGRSGALWDALGCSGAQWRALGRSGALWDALGRSGTLGDALGYLPQNQKYVSIKLI